MGERSTSYYGLFEQQGMTIDLNLEKSNYYQSATEEGYDTEGFLHTGDIGHFNEDGWLTISDRLKEMIKVCHAIPM